MKFIKLVELIESTTSLKALFNTKTDIRFYAWHLFNTGTEIRFDAWHLLIELLTARDLFLSLTEPSLRIYEKVLKPCSRFIRLNKTGARYPRRKPLTAALQQQQQQLPRTHLPASRKPEHCQQ